MANDDMPTPGETEATPTQAAEPREAELTAEKDEEATGSPKALSDPLDKALADLKERTEDVKRVSAEFANFRRRTLRDREAVVDAAKTTVITDFLPLLDDLDLAKKHGDLTGPLKAIADKIQATFTRLGVTRFGASGETFDPAIHEAVQDLSSGEDKTIGQVLRPGFMLGDKLVRTAMVIIADAPEKHQDSGDADDETER